MNINDAFYILQQCNSVTQGGEVAEALNVVTKEYVRLREIEQRVEDKEVADMGWDNDDSPD